MAARRKTSSTDSVPEPAAEAEEKPKLRYVRDLGQILSTTPARTAGDVRLKDSIRTALAARERTIQEFVDAKID